MAGVLCVGPRAGACPRVEEGAEVGLCALSTEGCAAWAVRAGVCVCKSAPWGRGSGRAVVRVRGCVDVCCFSGFVRPRRRHSGRERRGLRMVLLCDFSKTG